MSGLIARGAKCIPNVRLTIIHPIWHATAPLPLLTRRTLELDFFRAWLSANFYDSVLVPSVNKHMDQLRKGKSKSNKGYRGKVTRAELERWLVQHWMKHLFLKGRIHDHLAETEEIVHSLITPGRAKAISSCVGVDDLIFEETLEYFNKTALELVKVGDTITIDETMLQHFSKAARQAKELHFMPKKPHPYGLKQFRAVTLLCHTNKRAILSILPVKLYPYPSCT